LTKKVSNFLTVGYFLPYYLLAQWLIAQNTVLRRQIGIAKQAPS